MNRLIAVWLLVVIVASAGCSRTLTRESASAGGVEDIRTSESCASACLVQLEACADDAGNDAQCAAESSRCAQSCAHAEGARVYAFYCQAEAYTRRGLVLSDDSCVGATRETFDEQRSRCERELDPPPAAFAFTVHCSPVMSWVDAAGEAGRQ